MAISIHKLKAISRESDVRRAVLQDTAQFLAPELGKQNRLEIMSGLTSDR